MKQIPLTKGQFAIVDDEDYDYLMRWKWSYCNGYASRSIWGRTTKVTMHRLINQTPDGLFTDHINGDKLDNRKCNLRNCNTSQNTINAPKKNGKKYTSEYKGVFWDDWPGRSPKWVATIRISGKKSHLGRFAHEEDAATAYNLAAFLHHGEFAHINRSGAA
jgi:hypothetical protein